MSVAAKLWALIGLLAVGCPSRELKPVNPCTVSGVVAQIRVNSIDNVDLLLMVDNSNSMEAEQISLGEQIPRLIQVLASGDTNGDGEQEFPPVKSLHVGVISSDMGTGEFDVSTCRYNPPVGDDGVLIYQTRGLNPPEWCPAGFPTTYFTYDEPENTSLSPEEFAQQVSCVALLGIQGCGYEQQLDAVLKALVSSGSGVLFSTGVGHEDTDNAGFLRDDSLLAILMLTDEDDCSSTTTELFAQNSPYYQREGEHPNLRCFYWGDSRGQTVLQSVDRYSRSLLSLRSDPALLVFGAITGIPERLSGAGYQEILDPNLTPEMVETVNAANTMELDRVCPAPGADTARGVAYPARRIVRMAQQLEAAGASTTVHSICSSDYTPAIQSLIDKIAVVLGATCLPHELNPSSVTGLVPCDVIEKLSATKSVDFKNCDGLPGRQYVGTEDNRALCRVIQRLPVNNVAPTEYGWFYDDFTAEMVENCGEGGRRISFVEGSKPQNGSDVRLECLQPAQETENDTADIGTTCTEPDAVCPCPNPPSCGTYMVPQTNTPINCARALKCEGQTGTWQVPCDNDASCTAAGLISYVCAPTTGFDGVAGNDDDFNFALCVNPTCGQ